MPLTAAPDAPDAPETTIVRDSRLDQMGFVNELIKHHYEPLNKAVKQTLKDKGVTRATGDFFTGLLVDMELAAIDPGKFLKLYESGQMTRAQYLQCVKVAKKPATEFLSGKQIAAISTPLPSTTALTVSRIKTVEIGLVDAVRGLAEAIK